jgi:predicted P-loop ATPase
MKNNNKSENPDLSSEPMNEDLTNNIESKTSPNNVTDEISHHDDQKAPTRRSRRHKNTGNLMNTSTQNIAEIPLRKACETDNEQPGLTDENKATEILVSTLRKQPVTSEEYIEVLERLGYKFKQNMCNDRVEVNGEPITDTIEAILFSKLRDAGYPQVNIARDAFIAYASYNSYHPIRDYLSTLHYDGGQPIAQLASYFTNPDKTFEPWLRRWLIGAVRRVIEHGKQNRIFVLDGPQNIGKSKFVNWLVPYHLREKYFKVGPINPDNKDCLIALTERWIWEIAELGSTTRRADREALKSFISLEYVSSRTPYDRYEKNKPALSSFIGTVNNEGGVLSDPTGNRRFLFSKITSIDWQGYTENLTPEAIWAEALHSYQIGEPADLTPEEYDLATQINSTYEVEQPIEGILLQYYTIDPSQKEWWTSTAEIMADMFSPDAEKASFHGSSDLASKNLASLMTSYGCESCRKRRPGKNNPERGYSGIVKFPKP